MIPIIKQNEGMCHKKELGNVEGDRLITEILIPTSGTQCCEQMPQEEYCNAVSQSCVSQGKVGGKCLKHPEPNQGTEWQSAASSNVAARKSEDSRNEGDRVTPIVPESAWYKLSRHQAS